MTDAVTSVPEEQSRHSEYAIVINGELAVVPHHDVSYVEVVAIAYPTRPDQRTTYTVTYRNAEPPKSEGILVDGKFVKVKQEGTIFNVTPTGKS